MELGNIHKSKEGIFEKTSDNRGRLETLHWPSPLSTSFVPTCSDFVLIDGTNKTNIYNLSLVVTTVIDALEKSVPLGFLLAVDDVWEENCSCALNLNSVKNIYMIYMNIYLLFGIQIISHIHGMYITLMTNYQNVNVVYSHLQMYV